jgi:hypothetical protein
VILAAPRGMMMPKGAVPIVSGIPVCGEPAAAVAVRAYLRVACDMILKDLGEDAVAAIAVSGSATLGEFTAAKTVDDGLLLLSDVDLSVITRSAAQRNLAKSIRPALLRKLKTIEEASQMCAPVDLGVYSLGDLRAQSPKMGVLEMRTSGAVLWGEEDVLKGLPAFGPDEISKWEAIALLYNRCFESLKAAGAAGSKAPCDTMNLLYSGAKTFLDSGTSLAAFHGRYVTGYRRRVEEIVDVVKNNYREGIGSVSPDVFLEGLRFWTDFKIEADLSGVAARYGTGVDADGLRNAAWKAWRESLLPLTGVWRATSGAQGVGKGTGPLETCRELIGTEPALQRLRGWKRLVRAGEVPLARAIRLSRSGSPLHLLSLSAFCLLDQYRGGGTKERLEPGAMAFLEDYFPAPSTEANVNAGAEMWRRRVVDTWSNWSVFWS